MDVKIRCIENPEDITAELVKEMSGLLPQVSSSFADISVEQMKEVVGGGGSMLFVAEEAGAIVGSLTLVLYMTPTGRKSRIEDVVVDEKYRGQGIGMELSHCAIQRAENLGADFVDLTSRPDREAANNMYEKLGFEARETNVFRKNLSD